MRYIFLIYFLLFGGISAQLSSQSLLKGFAVEAKGRFGFLGAHSIEMAHIPTHHVFGGDLSIIFQTKGNKYWHKHYNYPRIGLSYITHTSSNNAVLGHVNGLVGQIEFPFTPSVKHQISAKIGIGLAYFGRIFDQLENPMNMAIGSHVNAMINLGINYKFHFGQRSYLLLGTDLIHVSNGATILPNLGLNFPFVHLGFGYKIKDHPVEIKDTFPVFQTHQWKSTILAIISTKQVYPTNGPNYLIIGLNYNLQHLFNQHAGVELGLDLFYKGSTMDYKPELAKSHLSIIQSGVSLAYVLPLDKLSFTVGMGVYTHDRYKPETPFYHRVGMRYQLMKHLKLNLTLKSHWGKADYIEYGIGYTF